MKKQKIIIVGFLLVMLLAVLSTNVAKVNAEEDTGSENNVLMIPEYKYTIQNDGSIYINEYIGKSRNIVIPETIDNYKVTGIGDSTFYGSNIESISMSGNIEKIDQYAFYLCLDLKKVTFYNEGLKEIGEAAFAGCINLKEISIPKTVKSIAEDGFYLSGLEKIICYQDSVAYNYAQSNNIRVSYVGPYIKRKEDSVYIGAKKKITLSNSVGKIKWKSSNPQIVKVASDGSITGVKKGTAKITAENDGVIVSCKVTVKDLSMNKKTVAVTMGHKVNLKLTGASKTITWKSSNSKVATVSKSGVVTGKKEGTATITARTGGKNYTCKVTVKKNKTGVLASGYDYNSIPGDNVYLLYKTVLYENGKIILTADAINNTGYNVAHLQDLNLSIKCNGKEIGKQKYSKVNISLKSKTHKIVKITVANKNVKNKGFDLRTGKMDIDLTGTFIYYY